MAEFEVSFSFFGNVFYAVDLSVGALDQLARNRRITVVAVLEIHPYAYPRPLFHGIDKRDYFVIHRISFLFPKAGELKCFRNFEN